MAGEEREKRARWHVFPTQMTRQEEGEEERVKLEDKLTEGFPAGGRGRRQEMGDGDEEMGTEGDEISLRGIINQSARWIGLTSRVLVCRWDWDWDWDLWTFLAQVPASLPAPFQPPPREILHESEGRGEVHVPTHSHAPIPSLVGTPRGQHVFGHAHSAAIAASDNELTVPLGYPICWHWCCVPSRPLRLTAESPWTKLGLSSNHRCTSLMRAREHAGLDDTFQPGCTATSSTARHPTRARAPGAGQMPSLPHLVSP
ncbi:hypothetical protein EDB89DRAFT_2248504 [Lactarius sanguifluus]|nr:hypothetical protein EDB89DRAFT_2248504 [Lactarius sanguifluus]